MMTDRGKKKKKRHTRKSGSKKNSSSSHRVEEDVLERALRADCSMLMASSSSFGNVVTLLIQLLTLLVLLLLSIVLNLLAEDSIAVSYIVMVTLLLTLLVHELGVTRWNTATFRLVLLWNLWVTSAVLFKLYGGVEVFGRVMGVLVSVFSTSIAIVSLFFPRLCSLFCSFTVLLLLFPLVDTGLFGDSTLVLSIRLSLYILLCMLLDRILRSSEQQQNDCPTSPPLQLSVSCFWVLLVLPQFWVASLLLLLVAWYKTRQSRRRSSDKMDNNNNNTSSSSSSSGGGHNNNGVDLESNREDLTLQLPPGNESDTTSDDHRIDFSELFKQ